MNPIQYLTACKQHMPRESDYALAQAWNIDRAYLSKMLRGLRPLSPQICYLVALTLNLDPTRVLADIEAQQTTGRTKVFWQAMRRAAHDRRRMHRKTKARRKVKGAD